MKFSLFNFELEERIFKFLAYPLVLTTLVVFIGLAGLYFFDNKLYEIKLKYKSQPYLQQSQQEIIKI